MPAVCCAAEAALPGWAAALGLGTMAAAPTAAAAVAAAAPRFCGGCAALRLPGSADAAAPELCGTSREPALAPTSPSLGLDCPSEPVAVGPAPPALGLAAAPPTAELPVSPLVAEAAPCRSAGDGPEVTGETVVDSCARRLARAVAASPVGSPASCDVSWVGLEATEPTPTDVDFAAVADPEVAFAEPEPPTGLPLAPSGGEKMPCFIMSLGCSGAKKAPPVPDAPPVMAEKVTALAPAVPPAPDPPPSCPAAESP
jgi:hypothetical protein